MRWHPATGAAVIALGNATYAAVPSLAARLLDAVVRQLSKPRHGYQVALAPAGQGPGGPGTQAPGPWPATLAAREAVSGRLRSWDDAAAGVVRAERDMSGRQGRRRLQRDQRTRLPAWPLRRL